MVSVYSGRAFQSSPVSTFWMRSRISAVSYTHLDVYKRQEVPGAAIAMTIFFLGTGIIAVFCIARMFYTNSFLIKRRKKELGLYCVLGCLLYTSRCV